MDVPKKQTDNPSSQQYPPPTPVHPQIGDQVKRRLCNGLQEESGSGLVCASSWFSFLPGWEQRKEEDGSAALLHLGQTVLACNFQCLPECSQELQMDRVYWTVDESSAR